MQKNRPQFKFVLLLLPMIFIFIGEKNCRSESSITARENLDVLIKTNSCRDCDLSGLNLNRMDLSGADLEGADLSLSKLFLVDLSQANLKNAKLNGAVFGGADLGDADLRGADLRGANLEGAYLGGALLEGKFITATPYADAGVPDLEKEVYVADPARSKKTPKKKDIQLAKPRVLTEPPPSPNLEPAQSEIETVGEKNVLSVDTAFSEQMNSMPKPAQAKTLMAIAPVTVSTVSEPDVTSQREKFTQKLAATAVSSPEDKVESLNQAVKIEPVLSEIIPKPLPAISKIDLTSSLDHAKRSNLQTLEEENRCYACDLSGLDFSGKNLKNVDLEQANLSDINFQAADMAGANLKGSNLRGANFKDAHLELANFYKADLSGADFTGADISGAIFYGAITRTAIGLSGASDSLKP